MSKSDGTCKFWDVSKENAWESEVSAGAFSAILKIACKAPSIWKIRKNAKAAMECIAEHEFITDTPSEETIFSWIEGICRTPHRRPGSTEGQIAEKWVFEELKKTGIEEIHKDEIPIREWNANEWQLSVNGKEFPCFYIVNTAFTPRIGLEAPLAYIGRGRSVDFKRVSVKNKIAVAEVPFPVLPTGLMMKLFKLNYFLSDPSGDIRPWSFQYLNFVRQNFLGGCTCADAAPSNDVYWQSVKRGALGVVLILNRQPSGSNTHYGPFDGIMKPIPGLWVGRNEASSLRKSAKRGDTARLRLTGFETPSTTSNIWGVLPGVSDEIIMVTSHHDSPFKGAAEDGAGVAQVLAQAWTWSRIPKSKRSKTIVFVLDAGHFYGSTGAHNFALSNEGIMEKARILITLEHLGGREVKGKGNRYVFTGKPALTVMFTSPDSDPVAIASRAVRKMSPRSTALIPADLFGPAPTSDALGYVLQSSVPVISWIGCPYYLLDESDTLDKIDKSELDNICKTVTEIVATYMNA